MNQFFLLSFYTIVLLAAARITQGRIRAWRQRRKAAAWGCSDCPSIKSKGWLGRSILKESLDETKAYRGPQFVIKAMNRISPNCHTARVSIMDYKVFITRDPENLKALFTSQDFDISGTRQLSWLPLLGKGIFTSRGQPWKHSRTLLRPQFAKSMVSDVEMLEQHYQVLIKHLVPSKESGWTDSLDIQNLFLKFTLDTTTDFVLGRSTHVLSGNSKHEDILEALDASKVWIDRRGALAKFYWLLNTKDFRENCRVIHKWVDEIVADTLAENPGKEHDTEKATRFNLLHELAQESRNPQELRNETLNVLIAGRDTSACLLSWLLYFLARNPRIYETLRAAIHETFGPVNPNFQNLRECTYLQWVLMETLRIIAIIPMNERVAMSDTILPTGGGADGKQPVFVPEGTQVLMPLYAVQHRYDLWDIDPELFCPERWETHKAGWEYTPFGGGRRKCLGQEFARTEAGYILARLCQQYDRVENMEDGDGELKLHYAIENRSGAGVHVRLHAASAK
ncbi:Cytochrome P450 52A11 [Paramyrothecium foliicola]|nr:Cytochrome P450 52A11 [Paramyrothecium foliicola]